MTSDSGYREVRGKIASLDGDGNPITSADLASGGARRDDGTLSSLAYDLEFVDGDQREAEAERTNSGRPSASLDEHTNEATDRTKQVAIGVAAAATVVVAVKAAPRVRAWWSDRAGPAVRTRLDALPGRFRRESAEERGLESHAHDSSSPEANLPAWAPPEPTTLSVEEWQRLFAAWQLTHSLAETLEAHLLRADIVECDEAVAALRQVLQNASPAEKNALANRLRLESSSASTGEAARLLAALFDAAQSDAALEPLALPKPARSSWPSPSIS